MANCLNLAQRLFEILLHIVRERLERADVDDLRGRGEAASDGVAKELVDADEECGEGLAAARWSGDEGGVAGEDAGPAVRLWLGGASRIS